PSSRARRRGEAERVGDDSDSKVAGMKDRDLLALGEDQVATGDWLEADRWHPSTLTEPSRAHRLGHAAAHSGALARQAVRDRHPEPLPILTPRHRRATRRPHRWATRRTRSTSPSC